MRAWAGWLALWLMVPGGLWAAVPQPIPLKTMLVNDFATGPPPAGECDVMPYMLGARWIDTTTGTTYECVAGGGGSSWQVWAMGQPFVCNTVDNPACLEAITQAIPGAATPYPRTVAGAPAMGACQNVKDIILDSTNNQVYHCPGGVGTNPVNIGLVLPYWNQLCTGGGACLTATGADRSYAIPGNTRFFPASEMEVSGGCTKNAAAALVTNGPRRVTITCTDADVDSIEFDWVIPAEQLWNAGPVQFRLVGFSIGTNNGEIVEMDFAGRCVRDGDAVVAHVTTGEQASVLTFGNQANDEQIGTTSLPVTLQGTCAPESHLYFRGQIDATATTLTPMTDVRILGVIVIYGTTN